jgi:hypothetical protein
VETPGDVRYRDREKLKESTPVPVPVKTPYRVVKVKSDGRPIEHGFKI